MKTTTRTLLALAASICFFIASAEASELLFSQNADGQSTYGPSELWPAASVNSEIADDFDVVANIDRVSAGGFIWGTINFQGVYVRFYEFGADGKPGALQREYFLPAGDPDLVFNSLSGAIDAYLSPAFAASGRHFLTVQPLSDYWYW